jgi:hypothetical protein
MATPILSTVTGSSTGNASERIGQNATIAGTSLNDANTELLIRDPDEAPTKNPLQVVEVAGQTVDRTWRDITSTPSGDVYAVVDNGRIYWQEVETTGFIEVVGQTVNRNWYSITSTPSGDVYAAVHNDRIYWQEVGTTGFIEVAGQTANRLWVSITSTPSGDVYAVVSNGRIYWQGVGTTGFIEVAGQTVNRNWYSITSTPSGDVYAVVYVGRIYWQEVGTTGFIAVAGQTVDRDWFAIASTPSGDVYAVLLFGRIYTLLMEEIFPYQNITDQIQSSTETEIIFQTPEFELGTYKLAVENNDGISNELDFEILESTPIPTLISVIGSTTGNNTERANLNATITGTDFLVGALLNLLIKPVDAIDWIDISDRIVSATDTTIVFTTPDITLGNYLLAVQNEIGISNELYFGLVDGSATPQEPSNLDLTPVIETAFGYISGTNREGRGRRVKVTGQNFLAFSHNTIDTAVGQVGGAVLTTIINETLPE